MQAAATAARQTTSEEQHGIIARCLAEVLNLTIEAFDIAGIASASEITRVRLKFQHAAENGEPVDVIELLARVQGVEEERMGIELSRIGHAVAAAIAPSPPLIPFAGKLMAPSAFYESYTQLHELARALLSPVIFAEDTDAIGTGALNPIAARIMASEIHKAVSRRFAIQPFVTAIRLDYESWSFLSRKHFEL